MMADKRNHPCPCGSGRRYKKCCGLAGGNPAVSEDLAEPETATGAPSAAAFFQRGVTAFGQKQLEEAARNFRQAITLQPDYMEALINLGVINQTLGKLVEAGKCFKRVIEIDPASPMAHCNLGVVQKNQGFFKEAEASFRRALAARSDFAEAHYNLGIVLEDQDFPDQAGVHYQEALVHKPGYVNALNRLGYLRKAQGQLEEAAACYLKALAADPENDMNHFNLARIRMEQGRLDEARKSYKQTLAVRPDYGEAHRCLASLVKYETETDQHLLAMENLFRQDLLQNSQRLHLAFALGKAYEDLAEYEKSFAFYQEGNRLKRATFSYATADTAALFEQIKKVFSQASIPCSTMTDADGPTPVFILGMPRSGTSLVEQILASHPEVYGAGELLDLQQTVLQITDTEQQHNAFIKLGEARGQMSARIGEEYLRRLKGYRPNAHLITDKLPANFLFIGLIRQALPKARIVHCRRDPMDTCLSIYKNFFAGDMDYGYDLTELGEFYRLYLDLMKFWHQLYPGVIHDVSYERLIADQERETRRLLDYCSLPWHQGCLNFHRTERRVTTASAVQVRRPIYRDSVALWRKYARQLAPLKEILEKPDH